MYNYWPNRENSIDEAMIPFEGRSSLKQYVSLKPVKQGFKVWVRVDSWNDYFCEFEMYTGKADTTAAITTNPGSISKQSLKTFRLKVASQLGSYCSRVRVDRRTLHPLPLLRSTGESSQQRALLNHLPHKAKSTRCLYCSKIRRPTQRRETVWYCPGCEGQPPLCLSGCDDGLWHSSQH